MRTLGVVTVARSDYGIYLPVLRKIDEDPDLNLHLIVAGAHLSPEFGLTVSDIEDDGFAIGDRIDMLLSSDTPESVSKSMGLGMIGFAQSYARFRPDILLALGDRSEMCAAVLAALPFMIPVAHIHGGETTEGAIDEALRHSITKMSHLHFVSTDAHARRVIQLGEEPWRVFTTGAPGLDDYFETPIPTFDELAKRHGLNFEAPFLLTTYHPVTLEYEQTEMQVKELLAALEAVAMPVLFTLPSADTNRSIVVNLIEEFVSQHPTASMVYNLGKQGYLSAMKHAAAMVGNSSSGIIEAASYKLPVVNVGNRQSGRLHGENVIHSGYGRVDIVEAIKQAASAKFRARLSDLVNLYGDGQASKRIVRELKRVTLDGQLLKKRFYDISHSPGESTALFAKAEVN